MVEHIYILGTSFSVLKTCFWSSFIKRNFNKVTFSDPLAYLYNFLYTHAIFHATMRTSVYDGWWHHHVLLINIKHCSLARLKARYLTPFLNTIFSTFCFNRCHYAICHFLFINLCTRVVFRRILRDLKLFVLTTGTMVVWSFSSCFKNCYSVLF